MANSVRQKRVADRIRAELGEMLARELSDPRLKLVTITDVSVDRELAYANIWVCRPDGNVAESDVLSAFERAKGLIRRELAARVQLRNAPQLIFHWDRAPDHAEKIAKVLDHLKEIDPPAAKDAES